MHACIFCTSNPRGQTSFFASYVLTGNSLFLGNSFFNIIINFSKPESVTPTSAFHFSNSNMLPSFLCPSSQPGYNNLWWSSNILSNCNLSLSVPQSLLASEMARRRSSSTGSSDACSSPPSSSLSSIAVSKHSENIDRYWSSLSSSSSPSSIITPSSPCLVQTL